MLKIMEHIFMMTACRASADAIVCQTRDELHEARKVNSGNAFYGYSAGSSLKNAPCQCGCDRLICPHPVIQIINLTLKKASLPSPSISDPYIYTF